MDAEIELREITGETAREIFKLEVAAEQRAYVAPNDRSIAEAHFEPHSWFRGIYAADEPVGFVMLLRKPPEFWVWRFMIDASKQRLGFEDTGESEGDEQVMRLAVS